MSARISTRAFTTAALLLCVLVAAVLSRWASKRPDGLEAVAEEQGFAHAASPSAAAASPLAEYSVRFFGNSWFGLALAGLIGCACTFAVAWLLGRSKAAQ